MLHMCNSAKVMQHAGQAFKLAVSRANAVPVLGSHDDEWGACCDDVMILLLLAAR